MGYKGIPFFLIITRMFRKIYFKIILIPYLKTCINILIWCILNSTINTGRLSHQQNQLNLYNTIKKKLTKKWRLLFFSVAATLMLLLVLLTSTSLLCSSSQLIHSASSIPFSSPSCYSIFLQLPIK